MAAAPDVPPHIRRSWEAASAEVSNLVLTAPGLYERAMILVRRTVEALRPQCPNPVSLLAFVDDAEATVVEAAAESGVPTAGLRLDLIASVALSMRSREIAEKRARRARLDRLANARDEGRPWVCVEELGDPGRALVTPYHRSDVHIASGTALVATAEPDETFAHVVYRLWWERLDPVGRLVPDEDHAGQAAEYSDREAWEAALAEARRRLASA